MANDKILTALNKIKKNLREIHDDMFGVEAQINDSIDEYTRMMRSKNKPDPKHIQKIIKAGTKGGLAAIFVRQCPERIPQSGWYKDRKLTVYNDARKDGRSIRVAHWSLPTYKKVVKRLNDTYGVNAIITYSGKSNLSYEAGRRYRILVKE